MPGRGSVGYIRSFYDEPKKNEPQKEVKIEMPKVFISYNHNDLYAMRAVKSSLEEEKILVTVDIKDIKTGQAIQAFIDDAISNNDFVLSIISKNSLLSGWVNRELTSTYLLNKLGKSHWLPVRIDNSCFDTDFYFASMSDLEKKILSIQESIKKAFDLAQSPSAFFEEYNRLNDLKNNFSNTISILKEVNVTDISGEKFDIGMYKIIKQIKSK